MSNVNDLNIPLSVITGDFNVRSSKWWSLYKENAEGREISSLTSACGYSQIINQPTHIKKEYSSCIDLLFTTSPNLINDTGVDLSLFDKCHHSLIYGIIDFKVPLPPLYLREVWDYKNTNSSYIQSAGSNTDWDFLFGGADDNKKVIVLNECLKNILYNFIPNRIIKCNYRHPPWMTDDVKTKLKERSKLTKKYYKNGNMESDFHKVIAKSNECTEAISAAKDKYIKQMCEKLNDPLTENIKSPSQLLSNKKVPHIPPVLFDRKIISNFSQEAAIFNKYSPSQCTTLQNSSSLTTLRPRTNFSKHK